MKTQISSLLSGARKQVLNPELDYSKHPQATSHIGHAGSNKNDVREVFEQVKEENPHELKIEFMDFTILLKANWSVSGKSCHYYGFLPIEIAEKYFMLARNRGP